MLLAQMKRFTYGKHIHLIYFVMEGCFAESRLRFGGRLLMSLHHRIDTAHLRSVRRTKKWLCVGVDLQHITESLLLHESVLSLYECSLSLNKCALYLNEGAILV